MNYINQTNITNKSNYKNVQKKVHCYQCMEVYLYCTNSCFSGVPYTSRKTETASHIPGGHCRMYPYMLQTVICCYNMLRSKPYPSPPRLIHFSHHRDRWLNAVLQSSVLRFLNDCNSLIDGICIFKPTPPK